MRERARRRGGVEVGDVPPGVVPVRDVGERREPVGPDVVELPARQPAPSREGDPDERDEQRGEEAAGPPQPEAPEVDAAAAPRVAPRVELEDEQRRDEEAGQDEEQVDAEEPAGQPVGAQVEGDDGRHRQPAQPVQPGHRPEVRPRRSVERCSRGPRPRPQSYPSDFRLTLGPGRLAGWDRRVRPASSSSFRSPPPCRASRCCTGPSTCRWSGGSRSWGARSAWPSRSHTVPFGGWPGTGRFSMTRSDAVRRVALDELLARYRPPGRGPTLSPPREGAPAQWHAVAADPRPALARAAGGPGAPGLRRPRRPLRRTEPAPPVDIGLAELFADAVADVSPASRLTELITNRDADDPMDDLGRAAPARRQWSMPARGRRWLGGAVAAFAVVVRAGRTSAPTSSPARAGARRWRPGSARPAGRWSRPPSAPPQSSCPSADPMIGPGGTALPEEGATEPAPGGAGPRHGPARPRRAAPGRPRRADHRPRRARASDGTERRRAGPQHRRRLGRPDPGRHRRRPSDCPPGPEAWKGVPLVFTTRAAAAAQPDAVVAGAFTDGTPWEVRDRPGHGLCASLGDEVAAVRRRRGPGRPAHAGPAAGGRRRSSRGVRVPAGRCGDRAARAVRRCARTTGRAR